MDITQRKTVSVELNRIEFHVQFFTDDVVYFTDNTAAKSSKRGTECTFVGASLHFPKMNST